jgi:hypothetical protein
VVPLRLAAVCSDLSAPAYVASGKAGQGEEAPRMVRNKGRGPSDRGSSRGGCYVSAERPTALGDVRRPPHRLLPEGAEEVQAAMGCRPAHPLGRWDERQLASRHESTTLPAHSSLHPSSVASASLSLWPKVCPTPFLTHGQRARGHERPPAERVEQRGAQACLQVTWVETTEAEPQTDRHKAGTLCPSSTTV